MGNKIIISKHAPLFDELLKLKKINIEKINYKIDEYDDKQHLSLFEINRDSEQLYVKTIGIYVELKAKTIKLDSSKAYILLLIHAGITNGTKSSLYLSMSQSLEALVKNFDQFTDRGLNAPFSIGHCDDRLQYKLYLLNGKKSAKDIKAFSVLKALELEKWLKEMRIYGLTFIYNGYFVDKMKIKSGNRINLVSNKDYPADKLRLPKTSERFLKELLTFNNSDIDQDANDNLLDFYFNNSSLDTNTHDTLKDNAKSTLIYNPRSPKCNGPFKISKQMIFSDNKNLDKDNQPKNKKSIPRFNLDLGKLRLDSLSSHEEGSVGRETTRKIDKLDEFKELCSDIFESKLYVGGYNVAKNIELLKANGITHILNCAGDYCPNIHSKYFVYKTYYIKDTKIENIECIFYDAIEFIETAVESGGRVLIHCVQGVSRSVTVCSAYLIYKKKWTFDKVLNTIKDKRGIASPNIGFIAQLILFQKRINSELDEYYYPKVFCFGSHQLEDARTIVGRHVI